MTDTTSTSPQPGRPSKDITTIHDGKVTRSTATTTQITDGKFATTMTDNGRAEHNTSNGIAAANAALLQQYQFAVQQQQHYQLAQLKL